MCAYFIKKHFKTSENYPGEEGLHFTEKALSKAQEFADSEGFLLYETAASDTRGLKGAKAIYGYGYATGQPFETERPRQVNNKIYPYVVNVTVEKALSDHSQGIPLEVLREKYQINMMPTLGGVVKISKEVFEELKGEIKILAENE